VEELKGFEKVHLAPGETRRVSIDLNRRSLSYWSDEKRGWEVDPGKFVIYVGDSSEHTPLTQDFEIH
jgi:beta-glucosidase